MSNQSADYLELISLNERFISFNRLYANSVRYYHWHQCLEVLYVEQGYGVIIVDNQQYTMRPGRLFIFPPFKLHKVLVEDSQREIYRRTIIHLDNVVLHGFLHEFPKRRAQLQRLCRSDSPAAVYDLSANSQTIDAIFTQFNQVFHHSHHQLEDVACLILQLMTFLPSQTENHNVVDDSTSAQVMQWIENHYQLKFSLDALAASVGLSKSYVSRRFRQETGGSIHEYLLTRRIKRACELLRTTVSAVEEISLQVGFAESPYFITCFKKMIGLTPLQYRKGSRLIG